MTKPTWRHVMTWAARLAAGLVLGLVAFALVVLIVIPRATHGTAMTVLTGSMTPGIPVGSVVIDRPVDPGTLHVGDIATYQKTPGKAEYITHRIVKIDPSKSPTEFTFKGDANRGPDITPVPATAIRGKVWFHVPYLGSIRDAIQTKGGLAGIAMVLLAGYALFQLAGAYKDRKGAQPSAPIDEARVPVASSADAVDLATVQRRLALLTRLGPDEAERMAPSSLLRLISAVFLDGDDDTFAARMADEASMGPVGAAVAPTADAAERTTTASPSPWSRYAPPLCTVPHAAEAADEAPPSQAPSYWPPQYTVPADVVVAISTGRETYLVPSPAITALDVLRQASDGSDHIRDLAPDVNDVRPVLWDGLTQEESDYLRWEHARV